MQRLALKVAVACITFVITNPSCFGALLPGTVEPGVVSKSLSQQIEQRPSQRPISPIQEEQKPSSTGLGPQAEKIKFKLNKIILEGNHVYSEHELSSIYKDKLGKTISVAQLVGIVQSITNYYRNNGYILSRAILPPQRVANGVVRIRVLEGFIDKVTVIGTPKGAKRLIYQYISKITQSRPMQVNTLEYYLRLANTIPGVQVKAVLEPSKTTLAASHLNIVAQTQTLSGYFSYDNYGSLYIGPLQLTASGSANSIFRSGDTTRLTYITTTRPKELKYTDLYHDTPLGGAGLRLALDANQSLTRPGLNLAPLKINGQSNIYIARLYAPLILSRATDLTLSGEFDYTDAGTDTFNQVLYMDHIRSLRGVLNWDHSDSYYGINNVNWAVEQGINVLGATQNSNSLTISRFGASGIYTKTELQASRLQQFGTSRYSFMLLGKGQYSAQPLLASEQFIYGGSQLGRGYDAGDIIGDLGLAGSAELRMNVTPEWYLLQFFQPYIFYDAGVIWNRKNIPGTDTKQSETSTGIGVRVLFTKNLSGNLMWAQPLTKQDAAEAVVGNGRRPRVLFSITLGM